MTTGPGTNGAPAGDQSDLHGPPEELDLTKRRGESAESAGLSQPEDKPYDPAPE